MGVPGLDPETIGTDAELAALKSGVASKYAAIEGLPELKTEISRFAKCFLNIDASPECCVPTSGAMQGSYAAFMVACRRDKHKDTALFIDPGFPAQKQQMRVQGLKFESFDLYDHRGDRLRQKLEQYLSKGNINTIIYSNPNNPTWMCLDENELQLIAELADHYGSVVIEDLAYFAMDFRTDYAVPGMPPYQPTVARYTDNCLLLISASKIFSYAGQRIGMVIMSDALYHRKFADLEPWFAASGFGHSLVYGCLYALTSGTAHSAQYALKAMLQAANEGVLHLTDKVKTYGENARRIKRMFFENGFQLVYEKDHEKPLADGFYFTATYPGYTGRELVEALLYYGISAISLSICGSQHKEGIRVCVSQVMPGDLIELEKRIVQFHHHQRL
jgi:aspartate/methionine/tyrosine aminotransferase